MKVTLLMALLITGCATGYAPLDVAPNVTASGDVGEVSTVTKTVTENIVHQMEWWQFLLVILLAGWAIPSPLEMCRGLFNGTLSAIKAIKGVF